MVVSAVSKLADEAKSRFGGLALVISIFSFVGSVLYFISDAELIDGLDLGSDADVFGWYLMVLSMFFAIIAFVFGMLMSKKED